jgi:hypothetical protein
MKLGPELDNLHATAKNAATSAELNELAVAAKTPHLSPSYRTINATSLLSLMQATQPGASGQLPRDLADLKAFKVADNQVWSVVNEAMNDGDARLSDNTCSRIVPHPDLFTREQASAISAALASSPCPESIESVDFLVIAASGDDTVKAASAEGEEVSFGQYAIPTPPAECDLSGDPLHDVSSRAIQSARFRATTPDSLPIGPIDPGSGILIPIKVTLKAGLIIGPILSYDHIDLIGDDGQVKSMQPIRPEYVQHFHDVSDLGDALSAKGC